MRAAEVQEPNWNRRRTAKRPATQRRNSGAKVSTVEWTAQFQWTPEEYREIRYRRLWARVWKGFWCGYGAVTVIALIQVTAGMT